MPVESPEAPEAKIREAGGTEHMRHRIILVATAIVGIALLESCGHTGPQTPIEAPGGQSTSSQVDDAYLSQRSNIIVTAEGTVDRVLADDTSGDQHQRFVLRLPSGLTILVAHNIDVAPRIPGITTGSSLKIHGEYEWSAKGGTVHWTHRDHRGSHEAGWIEFKGQRYD